MKITSMTKHQKNQLSAWVDKWVKIGLCTDPADFDKAEAAAMAIYDAINTARPKIVLRMGSPFGCVYGGLLAMAMIRSARQSNVRANVIANVYDNVYANVEANVRANVIANVRANVSANVRANVSANVEANVRANVSANVYDNVIANVEANVEANVMDNIDGKFLKKITEKNKYNYRGSQLWAGWYAYITYFRDVLGFDDPSLENFAHDEKLALTSGYSFWAEDVLSISDRPVYIKLDDRKRMHCQDGMAIKYRDGWGFYMWHGVCVPEAWIKKQVTAREILAEKNVEKRSAGCQIIGWDKIIDELDARVIDVDKDPLYGTLYEADMPDHGKQKFLKARCGTGRTIVILAKKEARTAKEAGAMSYGLAVDDYNPVART